MSKFEASKQPGGTHHQLAQLVGEWEGTARTWFEPDKLADTSPIAGTMRLALDGRFIVHEYRGKLLDQEMIGLAIHGFDLSKRQFTTAWVDSCHNGTAILLSQGTPFADPETAGTDIPAPNGAHFSVLGRYPDPDGNLWGWRTEIECIDADHLRITHYNSAPEGVDYGTLKGGEEYKGVEIDYTRKK